VKMMERAAELLLLDLGYTPWVQQSFSSLSVAALCGDAEGRPKFLLVYQYNNRRPIVLSNEKLILKHLGPAKEYKWKEFVKEQIKNIDVILHTQDLKENPDAYVE